MMAVPVLKPVLEEPSPDAAEEVVACEVVCGGDFGCVWHCHPEFEITLVLRGGSERNVGGVRTPLPAGDLVLLGPRLPHDFRNDAIQGRAQDPVKAVVVQFLPGLLGGQDWLKPASMHSVRLLFARADRGLEVAGVTRERAARILQRMPGVHGLKRLILLLHLLELLAESDEIREICAAPAAAIRPAQSDRISRVCGYIEEHLREPIYVEEMARRAGLGRSAFSRLFKKSTGRTLPQHVNALRISHAVRLLAETDMTVSQVAYECGFVSPAHFQREFRRQLNCTPLASRRGLQAADGRAAGMHK